MKILLDTPGIDEIRTAARWGVLDGDLSSFEGRVPDSGEGRRTSIAAIDVGAGKG